MTKQVHLEFARLPSVWASYPRVLLTPRRPLEEVGTPPEFVASVRGLRLDARRADRYSAMCGFRSGAGIPVTYPHVLAMPLHLRIFAQRSFPLRPMGLIHLSNQIECAGGLTPGLRIDIEVAARNYRRMDAGLAFDMDTAISSGDAVVWRETCVFMSRWPEPAARGGGRPPRPPRAPRDSRVLAETVVTLETAWAYARVSNDFNPIHLSDRAARFFGMRGAIAHGMWSLARSIAQDPPAEVPPGARLDTQFLTPVQLPARVAVKEWTEEGKVRRALCDLRTGRVHMYAWWGAVTPPA